MAQDSIQPGVGKRVCLAYPFFPHYRGAVNEELARRGRHRYTFLGDRTSAEPSIRAWDPPGDMRFVQARVRRIGTVYFQFGLLGAALSREYDVLVIHSGVWWPTTWACAALGRLTGKRVLGWGHGWTRPARGLGDRVRRAYYRLYHGHMTYGHYAKMLFLRCGWAPERVQVIYNSLDYQKQRAARESETGLAEFRTKVMGAGERPVVACVTRLIPVRRLDLLIDAAACLAQAGRPVDLLLVGDGPERARLERHAAQRGVRCVFYGACYDEAVLARLLMMSRVVAAPGKVGLTAIHALAYGVPVVTHDDEADQMPEWEAIIPGRTGSLFRKGDAADLARALGEWTGGGGGHANDRGMDGGVRAACIGVVERFWNPAMQRRCIERAIDGLPADDLFWMKEQA